MLNGTVDRLTALVTIEPWSDPAQGYLVRALIRDGEVERDVVGPYLASTAYAVRNCFDEIREILLARLESLAR